MKRTRPAPLLLSLALALFAVAAPLSGAQAARCFIDDTGAKAEKIAAHAFHKHRGEFEAQRKIAGKAWPGPTLDTEEALAQKVKAILDASEGEKVSGGRRKYWEASSGTIVIANPHAADCGTVFRPNRGKAYYDAQR